MTILLAIFAVQVVVAGIIIFVLKKVLDNILIENAVKQFEVLNPKEISQNLKEVIILVYKELKTAVKERIQQAAIKKLPGNVPIVFRIDKSIKGGIIINLEKVLIDGSLITRLRESGMWR